MSRQGLSTNSGAGRLFGRFRFDAYPLSRELDGRNTINRVLANPTSLDFTKSDAALVEGLVSGFMDSTTPPILGDFTNRHDRVSHFNRPMDLYRLISPLKGCSELIDYWPDKTHRVTDLTFDPPLQKSGFDPPPPEWKREQSVLIFTLHLPPDMQGNPDPVVYDYLREEASRAQQIVEAVPLQTKDEREAVEERVLDAVRRIRDQLKLANKVLPFPKDPRVVPEHLLQTDEYEGGEQSMKPEGDKAQPPRPRVFMSHASPDKDAFVLPLSEGLRGNGIDVWLDDWELLAGDDLGREIPEALASCDATVVVLSQATIDRPWVMEELGSAKYQQIVEGKRLIPVILGDLSQDQIPAAVRSTLQVRVPIQHGMVDSRDILTAINHVARAVFGQPRGAPVPLGQPPSYVEPNSGLAAAVQSGVELERTEIEVLRMVGATAVRLERTDVDARAVVQQAEDSHDLLEDETLDALDVLDHMGYIKIRRSMTPDRIRQVGTFTVIEKGIISYFKLFEPDASTKERDIYTALVEAGSQGDLTKISKQADAPALLVDLVARQLERDNILMLSKGLGPSKHYNVRSMSLLERHAKKPRLLTA